MPRSQEFVRVALALLTAIQVAPAHRTGVSDRIVEFEMDGALTAPLGLDAEAAARRYLESRVRRDGVTYTLDSRSSSFEGAVEHLTFTPRVAGIPFFEASVRVHVDRQGRVVRFESPGLPEPPQDSAFHADARRAGEAALAARGSRPRKLLREVASKSDAERRTDLQGEGLASPAVASRTWFASGGQARAAWSVYVEPEGGRPELLAVDAETEEIHYRRSLALEAEPDGYVFPAPEVQNPGKGSYALRYLSGRQGGGAACPAPIYPSGLAGMCWTDGAATVGNNVDACADVDGNDVCDGRALGAGARFLFPFTNAYETSLNAAADLSAALVNAFYWANVAHDWLYGLGFDEASGNFQQNNFGRGGYGSDAVRVDVQDGAVINNAWFSTPPDGIAPKMQLGLWPVARRDVAFDGDVMLHEYLHGLTNRLVGGPLDTGALFVWHSGAMGEGWSDAMAASFTGDPVIGEYATRNAATGVRTVRYDQSPLTFGQFGTRRLTVLPGTTTLAGLPAVHRDGEIWASTLWDVRQALGQSAFERIVVAALKLTPRRPSMLHARDAIVQAAGLSGLTAPQLCQVWEAFAARGMGASAALNPMGTGEWPDTALSVYESFDAPATCGGAAPAAGAALLEEGAETASGWTATGLWHRTARRAASGTWSWWFGREETGTYDTGGRTSGSLTSPSISLAGLSAATLEWRQYFRAEGFLRPIDVGGGLDPYLNLDSGRVWISLNGGSSWSVLSHVAHNTPGSGFAQFRVNLSRYAGQTIRLRFEFDTFTAAANANEGWYLDDIQVRAPAAAELDVSPPSLAFVATEGVSAGLRTFAITNAGGGSMTWTAATGGAPWLSLTPGSGSGPATVQVAASAAGLTAGDYEAAIAVNAGAAGSVSVPVTLHVEAAIPVGQWSFEETGSGPGVTVLDQTGHGRNGVTSGPGSAPAAGAAGLGRVFNGISDAVTIPADAALTPERLTARIWVKMLGFPSSFGVLMGQFGGANAKGWYLAVRATGEVVLMGATPPSSTPWLVSAGRLQLGRWHQVTATLNRTTGQARIFLDGALDRTGTFPGVAADPAAPLTFAKASWTNSYYLNAALDEALIFPEIWTAAAVAQDFASFSPPSAVPAVPVTARWSFEETSMGLGTRLLDAEGGGRDIVMTGTRHLPQSGVAGAARWFGGWPDVAVVEGGQSLATDRFSFSAWVRLDQYPASWGVLFGDYDGAWAGWYAGLYNDGRVILCAAGPGSKPWLLSTRPLSLGRWHHVAVTFDGLSRRGRIYLDGEPAGSATFPSWAIASNAAPTLGRAPWAQTGWLAFSMDEARFDAEERSAGDILTEYAELAGGLNPAPVADWRFEEGQGASVLSDSTGRGHGAQTDDPGAAAVAGPSSGAWRFSGSGGATVPAHPELGSPSFTFDAWIKLDAPPPRWGVLYSSYSADSRGWYVAVDPSGRVILCVAGQPGSAPWLVSAGGIPPGAWTHVAVTFDAVSRRGAIYLGGALDRTAVFPVHTPQTGLPSTIARASWTASYFLAATIDRARLWPREQSAQEVAELPAQ